jgi:hypothetical protein
MPRGMGDYRIGEDLIFGSLESAKYGIKFPGAMSLFEKFGIFFPIYT